MKTLQQIGFVRNGLTASLSLKHNEENDRFYVLRQFADKPAVWPEYMGFHSHSEAQRCLDNNVKMLCGIYGYVQV